MLTEVGQLVLEMLGYKVTACDGSLAALEIFHKAPGDIDLVISDVTMRTLRDVLGRQV
jgi:CheY-like chemotaxis protein